MRLNFSWYFIVAGLASFFFGQRVASGAQLSWERAELPSVALLEHSIKAPSPN